MRRLVSGLMNCSIRYPLAPCSSTPSKPAAMARREAATYSSMAARTSASVMARGAGCGCIPLASVYISPGAATALGASSAPPAGRLSGWPTRPVCMSCTMMRPPRACTASVTSFQPFTWAVDQSPGMRG